MQWLMLTDETVVRELRVRCRNERLMQNMTQSELAERAGLGINTVRRFEGGDDHSPSLETFVRIIRVLGALDALEQILPERPLDPLQPGASERQRARPSTSTAATGDWTWSEP